jgi:hypothetical protein
MKKFLNIIIIPYFIQKVKKFYKQYPSPGILVLDIDNTIADTWPAIRDRGAEKWHHFSLFKKLRPFQERITFFISRYPASPIIFLSTRNIVYYKTTKRWLLQSGFNNRNFLLILTLKVEDKLKYLEILQNQYKKVIYCDDLSYNHEHGEVKYYQHVIDKVADMKLEYWGFTEINAIK